MPCQLKILSQTQTHFPSGSWNVTITAARGGSGGDTAPSGKTISSVSGSFWLWSYSLKRPVSVSDLTGPSPDHVSLCPLRGLASPDRQSQGWVAASCSFLGSYPGYLGGCFFLSALGCVIQKSCAISRLAFSTPHKPALVLLTRARRRPAPLPKLAGIWGQNCAWAARPRPGEKALFA